MLICVNCSGTASVCMYIFRRFRLVYEIYNIFAHTVA